MRDDLLIVGIVAIVAVVGLFYSNSVYNGVGYYNALSGHTYITGGGVGRSSCVIGDGMVGDVDNNNIVDDDDTTELVNYLYLGQSLDDSALARADVNGDGATTMQDLLLIARFVYNKLGKFPKCLQTEEHEITDCTTITSPGVYKLNNDLVINHDLEPQIYCIKIQSSHVTLDCQNHELRYNAHYFIDGGSYEHLWLKPWGIVIDTGPDTNPLNLEDVHIKNCNIVDWPFSILTTGSGTLKLSLNNNKFKSTAYFDSNQGNGLELTAVNNEFLKGVKIVAIKVDVENNEFFDATGEYWHNNSGYGLSYDTGLRLYASNSLLKHNSFHDNDYGLYLSGENITLDNNRFSNNNIHIGMKGDFPMSIDSSWNISTTNTLDGKPIYFLKNKQDYNIPSNAGFVACFNCDNVNVTGLSIDHMDYGVYFVNTTNSIVQDSTLKAKQAIFLSGDSSGDLIKNNELRGIGDNALGIKFMGSTTPSNGLKIENNNFERFDLALYTKPLVNTNLELKGNTIYLNDSFADGSADGFILDFKNSFIATLESNSFSCVEYKCNGIALELRHYATGSSCNVMNNNFIRISRAIKHAWVSPGQEPAVIEDNYFSLFPHEKGEDATYGSSIEGATTTGFNDYEGLSLRYENSFRVGMYRLGGEVSPATRVVPDPPNKRALGFFKIDTLPPVTIKLKYNNLIVDGLPVNESSLKLYRYNLELGDWELVNATYNINKNSKIVTAIIEDPYFLSSRVDDANIIALMGDVLQQDNQLPVISFTGPTPNNGETINIQQKGNIRQIIINSNEQLSNVILQYQNAEGTMPFYEDFPDIIKELPMKMRYLPYNEEQPQQPLDWNGLYVSPYEWYCDNVKKYSHGKVVDIGCFKTNFNQKYRFRVIATDLAGNTKTTDWITFSVVEGIGTGFLSWVKPPTPNDNSLVTELPLELEFDVSGNCNPPISSATLLIKNGSEIKRFIPRSTTYVKITNKSMIKGDVITMRTAIGGFTCGDIKTKPLHLSVDPQSINQESAAAADIQLVYNVNQYDPLKLTLYSDTTISEAVVSINNVNYSMHLNDPFSAFIGFDELGLNQGSYTAKAFARVSDTDLWVESNQESFTIKCKDGDGFNPFVKSTVTSINGESSEDHCQGNNVIEYYCKPIYGGDVVIAQKVVNCSSCSNGACVDNQEPIVKLRKPRPIEDTDFDIEFSVLDNGAVDIDTVKYFIDSPNSEAHTPKCVAVTKDPYQWMYWNGIDCFDNLKIENEGEHTIIIEGDDMAGNSFSYDFTFNVNHSLANQNDKYVIVASRQGTIDILELANSDIYLKDSLNIGTRITALASQDNKLFVGDVQGNLHVIDFSNPENLNELTTYAANAFGYEDKSVLDIKVVDRRLFTSFRDRAFKMLDISNIQNPELVPIAVPHAGSKLVVTGNYLISYNPEHLFSPFLYTYDLYNLRYMHTSGIKGKLYRFNNILLSVTKNGKISTIDISDITNIHSPSLYWEHNLKYIPSILKDVAIKGEYAFIAASGYGLVTLDVSNPEWLKVISHYNTLGDAKSVDILHNKLLLADGDELLLFNITNPYNPELVTSFDDPSVQSIDFVLVPENTVSSRS